MLVNAPGILQRLGDALSGDLVQQDAVNLLRRGVTQLAGNVPGNRLTLTVGVGRQENLRRLLGFGAQFLKYLFLALNGDVFRREIVGRVDSQAPLGEVLHVAHRRLHREVGA